jgi:gluconate 2-dehydrogenase gamma chain
MKRRDTLKALSLSTFGMAAVPTANLVPDPTQAAPKPGLTAPGRVLDEAEKDAKLHAQKFFSSSELALLAVLSDIIIPADGKFPSASKVGVPAFIEFTAKDQPGYQTALRGGLAWLNSQARARFDKDFLQIAEKQRIAIIDDIAYPEKAAKSMSQGVAFFNTLRGLVVTGYYTTKTGFDDLGYLGNRPNQWEGVPADVLAKYGLSY